LKLHIYLWGIGIVRLISYAPPTISFRFLSMVPLPISYFRLDAARMHCRVSQHAGKPETFFSYIWITLFENIDVNFSNALYHESWYFTLLTSKCFGFAFRPWPGDVNSYSLRIKNIWISIYSALILETNSYKRNLKWCISTSSWWDWSAELLFQFPITWTMPMAEMSYSFQ
jgi:hypothetical protein